MNPGAVVVLASCFAAVDAEEDDGGAVELDIVSAARGELYVDLDGGTA